MKHTLKLFTLTAALGLSLQAAGQTAEDVLRFSRYNFGFGTARSAAMGGAFASLGADLSSMAINPAGLGMYRRSEFAITPSFNTAGVETSLAGERMNRGGLKINNFGGAFNVYNGGGAVTSVTFGFGYNKMIDLNSRSNVAKSGVGASRLDAWTAQLRDIGITPPGDDGALDQYDFSPKAWGAMNAYNSGLINYWNAGEDGQPVRIYNTDGVIDGLTRFDYDYLRRNKGSVGQYDFSLGFNLQNKVYLGLGFGIQELRYIQDYTYREFAVDNGPNSLDQYRTDTHLDMRGTAWNFKIGAIVRPVEELRIAAAFHAPTYIGMEEKYSVSTTAWFDNQATGWGDAGDTEPYAYDMRTPARLILGASYTFFDQAILSIDYERTWYDRVKAFESYGNGGGEMTDIAEKAREFFRPTHNLRAGLETMVDDNVFARVGYAFYDSPYRDTEFVPLSDYFKQSNYSAGLGYRTADWGIDLAYIYMDSKDGPDYAYYYNDTLCSDAFTAKNRRHNVTATLSFRF